VTPSPKPASAISLLLFPPLFVLGPLAGLLAASRPRSFREWWWIAAAVVWIVLSALYPRGLAMQTVYAWALCVTGAFVVVMLATHTSIVNGALLATALSWLLTTLWLWHLQLDWRDVQVAAEHGVLTWFREQLAGQDPDDLARRPDVVEALRYLLVAPTQVLPGMLTLGILPPLAIAWSWYRRLAAVPLGAPAQRFAEFRFSDQLIWGIVVGAVAMVWPLPAPFGVVLDNLTLVLGALYAARGAAVIWSGMQRLPVQLQVILGMGAVVVLPVSLGATFALGVADTWVDIRRRSAPTDQTRE
jgi:hypothetical protein